MLVSNESSYFLKPHAEFTTALLVAIFTEQGNLGGYFADAGAIAFVVIISVLTSIVIT